MTLSYIQPDHSSDGEITDLLSKGDPFSMKLLFKKYYVLLVAYSRKYVTSSEDAEDVVQSVMLNLWKNKQGVKFSGSLRSYLFGAVAKVSLQTLRNKRRTYIESVEQAANDNLDAFMDNEEGVRNTIISNIISEIELLPPGQNAVVTEIIFRNKAYKEVAQKLGISVNTVKTHYARALKHLRNRVDFKSE